MELQLSPFIIYVTTAGKKERHIQKAMEEFLILSEQGTLWNIWALMVGTHSRTKTITFKKTTIFSRLITHRVR